MADDTQTSGSGAPPPTGGLTIADDVLAKFGPIIELIKGSESMNNEERQYWINILPIMTPEQLQNLQEILDNEKKQLAAIDAKYSKEVSTLGEQKMLDEIEKQYRKKKVDRTKREQDEKDSQSQNEETLLNEINKF